MAKKSLGQHFLFDPAILKQIVEVAGLTRQDTVIEIGPGHGTLTRLLVEAASKVIAIELDGELFMRLKKEMADFPAVEPVLGDALRYRYNAVGPFKVVANIPYYITTPLIFRLIEARPNLISLTLTIQREVAERIVARPGTKAYGVLSLAVQFHTEPTIALIVPAGAFKPAPKVDSAVIHMIVRQEPTVKVADERLLFKVIRAAFSQRRKTVANALKPLFGEVRHLLDEACIVPVRRAETLSIEEFANLSALIKKKGLDPSRDPTPDKD